MFQNLAEFVSGRLELLKLNHRKIQAFGQEQQIIKIVEGLADLLRVVT